MTSKPPAAAPADLNGRSEVAQQSVSRRAGAYGSVSLFNPEARHLARAATDLDAELVVQIVQASIDSIGVVSTWEQLVQPVWQYLGSRTDENAGRAASECLYVQSAMRALSGTRRTRGHNGSSSDAEIPVLRHPGGR